MHFFWAGLLLSEMSLGSASLALRHHLAVAVRVAALRMLLLLLLFVDKKDSCSPYAPHVRPLPVPLIIEADSKELEDSKELTWT